MGKQLSSVDWAKLIEGHDEALVNEVKKRLESGRATEINPNFLVTDTSDVNSVKQLLNQLVELGVISKKQVRVCPVAGCGNILEDEEIDICPRCNTDYRQTGDEPYEEIKFLITGNISRDVPWLIAVHGMNTDGKWQEEFSWRIANKFWYHAPVLIFKYGLIRYRVLFSFFHKVFTRRLGEKISAAIEHARQNGINEPPDIVVHSFGSLLFSYLLTHDDFKNLKFGRVIVCGGIISPDFNWSHFIATNQIEAVLNHCSKKDYVVQFAQFTIPTSGPLGAVGSSDPKVLNVREETYGHSTYFDSSELARNLGREGVWDIFLKYPLNNLEGVMPLYREGVKWNKAYKVVSFTTRIVVILILPLTCLAVLWGLTWISVNLNNFFNWL
jgi:hypothetical protein